MDPLVFVAVDRLDHLSAVMVLIKSNTIKDNLKSFIIRCVLTIISDFASYSLIDFVKYRNDKEHLCVCEFGMFCMILNVITMFMTKTRSLNEILPFPPPDTGCPWPGYGHDG